MSRFIIVRSPSPCTSSEPPISSKVRTLHDSKPGSFAISRMTCFRSCTARSCSLFLLISFLRDLCSVPARLLERSNQPVELFAALKRDDGDALQGVVLLDDALDQDEQI